MTKFNKEDFTWDGMYLMYRGDFNGSRKMLDDDIAGLADLLKQQGASTIVTDASLLESDDPRDGIAFLFPDVPDDKGTRALKLAISALNSKPVNVVISGIAIFGVVMLTLVNAAFLFALLSHRQLMTITSFYFAAIYNVLPNYWAIIVFSNSNVADTLPQQLPPPRRDGLSPLVDTVRESRP